MPRYIRGTWNATCDRCGFDFKAFKLRRDGHSPGLRVCPRCYDPKHPQERLRAVRDDMAVPWARNPDRNPNEIKPYGIGAWDVNREFVVAPVDDEVDPVAFQQWLASLGPPDWPKG